MADDVYDAYLNSLLDSTCSNLSTATIKIVHVDAADYTVNIATHNFFDDVPAAGRVSSATLTSKTLGTVGAGVFDAADLTHTSVSGDVFENAVMYDDTAGGDATDPLILFWDSFAAVTPNGGNIVDTFSANGIFKIG